MAGGRCIQVNFKNTRFAAVILVMLMGALFILVPVVFLIVFAMVRLNTDNPLVVVVGNYTMRQKYENSNDELKYSGGSFHDIETRAIIRV